MALQFKNTYEVWVCLQVSDAWVKNVSESPHSTTLYSYSLILVLFTDVCSLKKSTGSKFYHLLKKNFKTPWEEEFLNFFFLSINLWNLLPFHIYMNKRDVIWHLRSVHTYNTFPLFNKSLYLFIPLFRNMPKPTFCSFTPTQSREIKSAIFTGQLNHLEDLLDWIKSLK